MIGILYKFLLCWHIIDDDDDVEIIIFFDFVQQKREKYVSRAPHTHRS